MSLIEDVDTDRVKLPTIESVSIDWMHDYANVPHIILHVDEAWDFPSPYSTWPHRLLDGDGLWLGTKDIWAHFVYDASERDDGMRYLSRGACTGNLLVQDRLGLYYRRVTSGWSSGVDCINAYLPESEHIVDVTLKGGDKYSIGRAGVAIRRDALLSVLPDGVYLVDKPLRGPQWVASIDPNEYRKAAA